MGYFRRFKPSDYTADQCRTKITVIAHAIIDQSQNGMNPTQLTTLLEEWACFRELLARHENQNKSQLDQS